MILVKKLSDINWPYLIALVLLCMFIIFVVCAIIQSHSGRRRRERELELQIKDVYQFKFDYLNKTVTYFKRFDSSVVVNESLNDFYNRILDTHELNVFKGWINNVLDGEETSLPNEVKILINDHDYLALYFKVISFDKKSKVIHCDGNEIDLYQDIAQFAYQKENAIDKKGISIDTAFLRPHGNEGYMIYIRIFPKLKTVEYDDTMMAKKELRKVCLAFINESNLRMKINAMFDNSSFPMIDYSDETVDLYEPILLLLEKKLISRFDNAKLSDKFDFCISVGQCSEYTNPNELLNELKVQTYFKSDRIDHIEWFSRKTEDTIARTLSDRNEIDTIINFNYKDRKIATFYTPLYSVDEKEFFGFYTRTEPFYTTFKSLNDMFKAAEKFDQLNNVYQAIIKRIISKYYNEFIRVNIVRGKKINKSHLLIDLYPQTIPFVIDMVKNTRYFKASNPIIMIDDTVLRELAANDTNNAFIFLQTLTNLQVELCYRVNSRDILWPNELLEKFDYFLIDNRAYVDAKINESTQLKAIFNKLDMFDRPYISVEVSDRNEFQALRDKGVKICGGEYLGAESMDLVIPSAIRIAKIIERK